MPAAPCLATKVLVQASLAIAAMAAPARGLSVASMVAANLAASSFMLATASLGSRSLQIFSQQQVPPDLLAAAAHLGQFQLPDPAVLRRRRHSGLRAGATGSRLHRLLHLAKLLKHQSHHQTTGKLSGVFFTNSQTLFVAFSLKIYPASISPIFRNFSLLNPSPVDRF